MELSSCSLALCSAAGWFSIIQVQAWMTGAENHSFQLNNLDTQTSDHSRVQQSQDEQ